MESSPETPQENGALEQPDGPSWRACDNCRQRKIKCDKRSPCSNCRASNTICRTSVKPREQKQRISVSNQYEKKIALMENRLSRMEGILQEIAKQVTTNPPRPPEGVTPSCRESQPPQHSLPSTVQSISEPDIDADIARGYEGESTFKAHSIHASKFIESTVHAGSLGNRSPEMEAALASLNTLVEKQSTLSINQDLRFSIPRSARAIDLSTLKMPPITSVISLLRICKDTPEASFLDIPCLEFHQFNDLCKKVFFATEDFSLAQFTVVNGGLFYLFLDVGFLRGQNTSEFESCADLCYANLEYALTKFDLFTAPTLENIQSLCLGAAYANDTSRPALSWTFSSHAIRLCQILGYHRSVEAPGDTESRIELKKKIFWFAYMLDRSLCLRLGRAPTLPDYDISLGFPSISQTPEIKPWDSLFTYWVDLARYNGRVFEQLYSARALSQPEPDRTSAARDIIGDLQSWIRGIRKIDYSQACNPYYYESTINACGVMYHTLATLVYRSIPPTSSNTSAGFSPECIEAARNALRAHQENTTKYMDKNDYIWYGYMSWILTHCILTPFIVVFCNAIVFSDLEDLKRLGDFVSSLHSMEMSECADKLCRLCHIFHHVAELYIKEKTRTASLNEGSDIPPPDDQTFVNYTSHFDPYLTALGFPSAPGVMTVPDGGMGSDETSMAEPGARLSNTGSLGDWFAGNVNIMSLLETDLSNIYPPTSYY